MQTKIGLTTIILILFTSSCKNEQLESQIEEKNVQIQQLTEQVEHMRQTNSSLLDRLSDLSVINKTEAKSIQSSLENLGRQNEFIQVLSERIHQKDSINLALVTNLKRSLLDINDEDIAVEVRGSAVYVSIADRLLFQSGSTKVSPDAQHVLAKVATVINDHDDLNVLIEGHTDALPISNKQFKDNWDLSVQRATSVVRLLQESHAVEPSRLTAAGRSHYVPKDDNETSIGRSKNRRTEIIITPKLDQFFKLLETPALMG